MNRGRPVMTSQTTFVILASMWVICLDVSDVMSGELVDGFLNVGQASRLAHRLGREIGMGAGAVPIALKV